MLKSRENVVRIPRTLRNIPREDAGGLSRENVVRIPSVS